MIQRSYIIRLLFMFLVTLCAMPSMSYSQNLADNLSGFGASSDEPIAIEADRLEVLDNQQEAVFSGNVVVKQGETTLQTSRLVINYQDDNKQSTANPQTQASGLGGGARKIKKLEASGKVLITSKDQTASGDKATMDMEQEIITMLGDVVLTQGGNIIRGEELVINLKTRQSRMIAGGSANEGQTRGRVQGLFLPGSVPEQ
jgi:lipopolysaccharide export system protein LptA